MYPRLSYNLFVHITPSHQAQGFWRHPSARHMVTDYNQLDPWVELARSCERGLFDTLFIGDTLGAYDTYHSSPDHAIRSGMQFPSSDPSVLVSALAYATEHLGFVVTSGVLQAHPFEFARRMSTLDHLTKGRVGWNIVTSYLNSAARNLGLDALPAHDRRYDMAEEYVEVAYKLWEASWDDHSVVDDVERNVMFEPSLVRPIDHSGQYYRSAGPHLTSPSPQRTPVLYQAGGSPRGKEFAGRHAEVTFLGSLVPEYAAMEVAEVRAKAVAAGRSPDEIVPITVFSPVIGSTEEEALRKQKELREWTDFDALMAANSGVIGVDLSVIDPDMKVEEILGDPAAAGLSETSHQTPMVLGMLASAPDPSTTFRDFTIEAFLPVGRQAGTPEQIADQIEGWVQAGVGGFNITSVITLGWIDDWVDQVVPVLQARGLIQKEYSEGTLREKLFGRGPYLSEQHRGRQVRRRSSAG